MTEIPRCPLARVHVRPWIFYASQGRTVLATGLDGMITGPEHGLFVHQTRLLSRYRYTIDGEIPEAVVVSNVEQHSWLGYYIALPPGISGEPEDTGSGRVRQASQQTLELRVSRYVGDGVHEDLDLTNYSQHPTSFRLELELEADFADQEIANADGPSGDVVVGRWRAGEMPALVFEHQAARSFEHQGTRGTGRIDRSLTTRVGRSDTPALRGANGIRFDVRLAPMGRWHCCLDFIPRIEDRDLVPLYGCRSFGDTDNELDRRRRVFLSESTVVASRESGTLAPVVVGALNRAKHDLAALRLHDMDLGDRAWTMAAGLPAYIALFGRDTLTAAWQASLASTAMASGTLPLLVRWQGTRTDDWRDEQPGKMVHEAHTGPLAMLGFNPRERYYGSITTSAFFPVAVSELWHWTGSKELVGPLIEPALKALRWLDEHADLDGDGFYEYLTRSEQGVKHQAWKDSGDAVVYEDGGQVEPPIATCEEQGFVYAAKFQLAELLWWMDEKERARELFHEARQLKERFNEAFWMPEEGYYALGLDAAKRQIRSITSNPGHCLATGIVRTERAAEVAARMLDTDLFSGWGIRTLSSRHPAYNPYSYHRGTVWPVEQGTFALGLMRFGLHEQCDRLCRAQFEAAVLFDHLRLPECFGGHPRDADYPFPAIYPKANSPQAWSASAAFCLLQSLLGLYPYAPLHMLLLDPHLPAWLPEITLQNLRVGEARVTIRFVRSEDGRSDYRVLDKQGPLHVLRQPSPWSLTASAGERIKDVLMSLLPGR